MSIIIRALEIKEKIFQSISRWLPHWLSPNVLSVLRALLIIPIFFLLRHAQVTWVIVLFIIALMTDVLDGIHARATQRISNVGKLLDPAADKILFVGLFLLAAPGRLSASLIYTILSLETILVLLATVIGPAARYFLNIRRKLGANMAGKIKMNLEGLAMAILLFGLQQQPLIALAEGILWLAAVFAFISIFLHLTTKEENRHSISPPAGGRGNF